MGQTVFSGCLCTTKSANLDINACSLYIHYTVYTAFFIKQLDLRSNQATLKASVLANFQRVFDK